MLAWLSRKLNPRSYLPPEVPEDRESTAKVVDALMSLDRKRGELRRELNERELAYQTALRNREGRP